jgi:hypothetical protein
MKVIAIDGELFDYPRVECNISSPLSTFGTKINARGILKGGGELSCAHSSENFPFRKLEKCYMFAYKPYFFEERKTSFQLAHIVFEPP